MLLSLICGHFLVQYAWLDEMKWMHIPATTTRIIETQMKTNGKSTSGYSINNNDTLHLLFKWINVFAPKPIITLHTCVHEVCIWRWKRYTTMPTFRQKPSNVDYYTVSHNGRLPLLNCCFMSTKCSDCEWTQFGPFWKLIKCNLPTSHCCTHEKSMYWFSQQILFLFLSRFSFISFPIFLSSSFKHSHSTHPLSTPILKLSVLLLGKTRSICMFKLINLKCIVFGIRLKLEWLILSVIVRINDSFNVRIVDILEINYSATCGHSIHINSHTLTHTHTVRHISSNISDWHFKIELKTRKFTWF